MKCHQYKNNGRACQRCDIQKPRQITKYLGENLQKLKKFWALGGNFASFENSWFMSPVALCSSDIVLKSISTLIY